MAAPSPAEPPLPTSETSRQRSRSRRADPAPGVPGGDAARARGEVPEQAAAANRAAGSKRPGSRPPLDQPQANRPRPPTGATGSQPRDPAQPAACQRAGASAESRRVGARAQCGGERSRSYAPPGAGAAPPWRREAAPTGRSNTPAVGMAPRDVRCPPEIDATGYDLTRGYRQESGQQDPSGRPICGWWSCCYPNLAGEQGD